MLFTILRIKKMESYLNEVTSAVEKKSDIKNNKSLQKKIKKLQDYLTGGKWLKDYQADEKGKIPKTLKRGILSQDTLYDLLVSLNHVVKEKAES